MISKIYDCHSFDSLGLQSLTRTLQITPFQNTGGARHMEKNTEIHFSNIGLRHQTNKQNYVNNYINKRKKVATVSKVSRL